ncbi:MAG: UDP-N-acetylmuramate--L-alanine ligase [Clostridia bacterium]|nr:UDP-N-acetylmuramate--L-alanine ligase [Clostridia bacterium]
MSSLALIVKHGGYKVSGSDIIETHITKKLQENGIEVFIGQSEKNINSPDLVVYTAAISKDNPEYIEAVKQAKKVVERSVFLGELMKAYGCPCCIAGTHGKTTTTSMVSSIMLEAQKDPTVLVGGEVKALGGNLKIGSSEIFVTEACEYVESFLEFFPKKAIILNVDADHLDYFKDIDHIISAFKKFAQLVPESGSLIVNGADKNTIKATKDLKCNIITFGIGEDFDVQAKNVVFDKNGFASYDLIAFGVKLCSITLSVPGKHNVLNSLAAAAMCLDTGCDAVSVKNGLENFKGTDRRFEIKGEYKGCTIVDDYAHHPTEIVAAIKTAKNFGHKKVTAIFQPHTYTRTKALLGEFAQSLSLADRVIVTDIYAAREIDDGTVSSKDLVDIMVKTGCDAKYIKDFDDVAEHIKKTCSGDELIMTVGAGPVYKIGEKLI